MLLEMTETRASVKTLPSNAGSTITENNTGKAANGVVDGRADIKLGCSPSKSLNDGQNAAPTFPPPKTDKPRPHICATCTRSFARLEHLKRHERSHTKEKPFACPDCTRCFARRDLLLRHQQKLHATALPASRQRGARRESASSAAPAGTARVRKNSMANNAGTSAAGSMRPRANTISHVDNATLGMLAAANSSISLHELGVGPSIYNSMNGFTGVGSYHPRGMSTAAGHHGNSHALPKLETKNHSVDIGASLRTAPPISGFGGDIDMQSIWFGSTINPAQLHYSNSPQIGTFESQSPYHQGFSNQATMDHESNFGWLNSFENQMSFNNQFTEQAIDESSPSAISTGSPGDMSEVILDPSNNGMDASGVWPDSSMSQHPFMPAYSMDLSNPSFPDLYPPGQLSPTTINAQMNGTQEQNFQSPPLSSQTPSSMLPGVGNQYFYSQTATNSDTPSNSAASISSSIRQGSVTSISTDSITDVTRQALLTSLSQPSLYGHNGLKTSQPQVSSPLSPGFAARSRSFSNVPLPSTYDLQRYVAAYIQYFHPHLPFLHIPTLSFDSPSSVSTFRTSSGHLATGQSGIAGGGGSLILAMAAIGALYEYDFVASKDLFEMAKRLIQLYLEERRKADMSAALSGHQNSGEMSTQNTPLWLVQAMLLNVIYGHNCGDKTLAGIASTHCAALINLARAADLAGPLPELSVGHDDFRQMKQEDVHMEGDDMDIAQWNNAGHNGILDAHGEWLYWKVGEERKRTLYAVFILSSLCVSAYNHAPALMNSEIGLDLPCDESLWSAESAQAWHSLNTSMPPRSKTLSFASALSTLLTAYKRPQQMPPQIHQHPDQSNYELENLPESEIKPSTFGCLVLINALHNYIWETRQRHMGRQWKSQETEELHSHIEPALRAWLAAWASHPEHSVERPNPFGASSLSADCIPYLDLAYVRLFVNLGRSKEAFFQRDFDAMAEELARGTEIVQHADCSSDANIGDSAILSDTNGDSPGMDAPHIKVEEEVHLGSPRTDHVTRQNSGYCSRRERHLRKAAVYAVNALTMSDALGVSFADYTSRELPLQSGLCAFDCAQVLAEWASTVQQRVGRYLGILGKDPIDFSQVPAIMLLEQEDITLFEKIDHVLTSAETKLAHGKSAVSVASIPSENNASMEDLTAESGYGSKTLLVHARMFEVAAVWPITREMCQSLRTQASHMRSREEASLHTCP